jgi:hypothetical protein
MPQISFLRFVRHLRLSVRWNIRHLRLRLIPLGRITTIIGTPELMSDLRPANDNHKALRTLALHVACAREVPSDSLLQ